MKAWLQTFGYSDAIKDATINAILREFVMSKVFPDEINGYSPKAWSYFCIGFNFYDEVEYPGIEPLIPKKPLKIISLKFTI